MSNIQLCSTYGLSIVDVRIIAGAIVDGNTGRSLSPHCRNSQLYLTVATNTASIMSAPTSLGFPNHLGQHLFEVKPQQ